MSTSKKTKKGILNSIDIFIEWLSIVLMSFMLLLTSANVFGRYVLKHSIFFSEEMARFLFVWVVFLGAAIIIKDKGHVAVNFFAERLNGRKSGKLLEIFIGICGFIFITIIFIGGITLSKTMNMYKSSSMQIPMGYVYYVIPIGAGIMMLHHIKKFLSLFAKKQENIKKEMK
jgi:TRAP-type C4-dicarboxylate transport system permease small subunit